MTIKCAMIGLGQIGASIGLALAGQKETLQRVGYDLDPRVTRQAQKIGAVDQIKPNLAGCVTDASVVILALPIDQIQETLEIIASNLKPNVVLMETAPVKAKVIEWIGQLLPEKISYIGLTPVINPKYLTSITTGIDAARADLFQNGLMAIVTPFSCSTEALKLATDLIGILGAEHMFVDPMEIDGLMSTSYFLPQLMAAALLNITVQQGGWLEMRKIAGRAYSWATEPAASLEDSMALATAVLHNRTNILRGLDRMIQELINLHAEIEGEREASLQKTLQQAREGRAKWWMERFKGNWTAQSLAPESPIPTSGEMFGRLFGLSRPKKRKQ